MKLLRFMSASELDKFRAGELLENTTEHRAKTDAIGFCFIDYSEYDEQRAYHFLSGIVSSEIYAMFEIPDKDVKTFMKKGSGTFADPDASFADFFSSIEVTEYSTKRYHNKAMKLLKFCDDFAHRYKDDSFERIFDFKNADAPVKRNIPIAYKSTPARPKLPDTSEQRLADALMQYAIDRMGFPPEAAYGFMLSQSPTLRVEQGSSYIKITTDLELQMQHKLEML